ncbi:TPA: ead/Ea22-like family protein [Escherichia coli]|uniref:ead/Ea22-like family protein n=1 Tax=Escherichia coli TaxID=562 RepID=UPI000B7EAE94|nr:ead/Ea22-like family protein [Escherichia coli]EAC1939301.1 ead/Ea22-like family protein [Escherichia coli]EEW2194597.1 ead/Ea22-like family protein [Escherichia coli]EEY5685791.1 ead/Ea22-like family protein [Escherichia coli]EFA4015099.1 ead/Ea22-like family protein [Escherichia coli]EFB2779755.1 ead/Ea22-like family protein [Escherichia coli]
MSKIDYQVLREAAEKAGEDKWQAKKINGDFFVIRHGSYTRQHGYTLYQPIAEIDCKPVRDFVAKANPATVLALLDELEAQSKRIAELEKSEEQLINERDHAESALADMYFAATGDRPEWSNWFGFSDAVDAVVDRIADLEAKQPSPVVPEGLVKAVSFYEQVKRENPPVETGAWKDAVDWVLKEAFQAVSVLESSREHEVISQQEKA